MVVSELESKINELLETSDYQRIFELLDSNMDTLSKSNELSYFFCMCEVNREAFRNTGEMGIVTGKKTVREVSDAFLNLKREVQRIAYCDEHDALGIPAALRSTGAKASELLWTINVSTPEPERVLNKLYGNPSDDSNESPRYVQKHSYKDIAVDFIICSNNSNELEEAIFYISRLDVPDGVKLDVISVQEACSLCAGYNEGMSASSAKYKVYMHQDVRIIDRDFVSRLIDLFADNENVGMIGMVGTDSFPADGTMWNVPRYGSVLETHVNETVLLRNYPDESDINAVLCDGLLLATQYDLPWREDLFDGWDFYDASQCMEFIRNGYRVLIPYQEKTWCVHDCGFLSMHDYEKYRQVFLSEYSSIL
ncbi:MAG: glycosyltransferase family protein [Lachnospiraceae bacterium]|nr:glycosyltransferase family protein [Lachnospiraceae bacterium]